MRVLLAIDGSPQSIQAVESLAHFGPLEEVTLVHATTLPDLDHPMISPETRDSVIKEVEEQLRKEGEAILDRAAAALPHLSCKVHRIHQVGPPSAVILESAQSAHADLIIMGARGLGPIKELVLGSVTHRVLLHAECSTLVMKSSMSPLRHILVPVEGDEDTQKILQLLSGIPFREPVHITVMTVWPEPRLPWPVTLGQSKLLEERAVEHAQAMVEEVVSRLKEREFDASSIVGLGDPAFTILEQARSLTPDLIMVSSHGRKGVSRFLLGSVSHTLVHQASCPVLVVR